MQQSDLIRLIALAAIWGSSFIFMRISAPDLGAFLTAELRAAVAGVFLMAFAIITKRNIALRGNMKHLAIVGALNSGIPFAMFCYAALHIPAAYAAICNSLSPLFGALFGALYTRERIPAKLWFGLLIGAFGVSLLVGFTDIPLNPATISSLVGCMIAACCYGLSSVYNKHNTAHISPFDLALGSMIWAGLILLPMALYYLPDQPTTARPYLSAAVLGVMCTAIAYLIFFRLLQSVGPVKTLTVTFLIPIFTMLWAYIFLNEPVTLTELIGCAVILLSTWIVVKH